MHFSLFRRENLLRIIKWFLAAIPIFFFLALFNNNFFLTKTLHYSYSPGQRTHIITPVKLAALIKTADRALPWRLDADSFPFRVTIPRLIEEVRVRVRLVAGTQGDIAFVAHGKKGADLTTIISSALLNTLEWKNITDGDLTLWMRDTHITEETLTQGSGRKKTTKTVKTERAVQQYSSISEFRTNPPTDLKTVATVGFEPLALSRVTDYQPSTVPITIEHTFRGSHQLFVYAANETLRMSFDKIDLNRQNNADELTVRIARTDDPTNNPRHWLKSVTIGDDGMTRAIGRNGKAQLAEIVLPNVTPGTYLIDIVASEDVVFQRLTSNQHVLAFNGRVFIADGPAYGETSFKPVSIITIGDTVTYFANHDQGMQTLVVAGKKHLIQDVKINNVFKGLKGETRVDFAQGDATVSSNGLLTLSPAQLVPPGAQPIDIFGSPDLTSFDYVLAPYRPKTQNEPFIDQTYNLKSLTLDRKKFTFTIESPGLERSGASLGLKDIRVTFVRGPFPWNRVWENLGLKKKL